MRLFDTDAGRVLQSVRQAFGSTQMSKNSTRPPGPTEVDSRLSVQLLGIVSVRRGQQSLALPKKAQGLLAYLALESGRPVPRDLLATLFWGSTATAQARQSLRQALAALRVALGHHSALIVADVEAVRLRTSSALMVDVTEFEAKARSTRLDELERAEEIYRGELLAGLQIPVEPFVDWLGIERQRLSTLRADQLHRLSEARSAVGDVKGALTAARQLTTHDPLREEGHRLLMRLLASDGQRSAALKQHATFAKLLNDQLGLTPDVETAQLAERIRAETNIVLPIRRAAEDPASAASKSQSIREEKISSSGRALPLPDKPSIVVLPFANLSGDASQDYFVDGLVDDITIALGREKWLFVISSPSAFAFKNRDEDPREIATKLGVRYVLRGSVRKCGRRVRVVVLLTDAVSGQFMWSDRYEDEADNVFELNDRLIAHLAAAIAPALRSIEIDRVQRQAPANLSAFELYLQAIPRVRNGFDRE